MMWQVSQLSNAHNSEEQQQLTDTEIPWGHQPLALYLPGVQCTLHAIGNSQGAAVGEKHLAGRVMGQYPLWQALRCCKGESESSFRGQLTAGEGRPWAGAGGQLDGIMSLVVTPWVTSAPE